MSQGNGSVSAPLPSHGVKVYKLVRVEDESGVSGTGHIAEVAEFSSGVCVMSWLTRPTSVAIYYSKDELVQIHSHGGRTKLELVTEVTRNEHEELLHEIEELKEEVSAMLEGEVPMDD